MAWSTVTTEIQNPAGKRSHMTAKQIRFFGTKRQKAALKAKRKKSAHRHSAHKHRPRTRKTNAAPRKKARKSSAHRHSAKRNTSRRSRPAKRNPGPELVAFVTGNSATKGKRKVAHSKKKRKSSARRSNAGTRRVSRKGRRHSGRRRYNPAGISVREMVYGGSGGLVGFFGSAGLAQMFLGTSNTGMTGYAVTAGITIGLTILSHMFVKDKSATFGVAIGGVMNLARRVITDQTPFGSYLALPASQGGAGMGDYMVANWGPPNMVDGLNSSMAAIATTGGVASSSGINMLDYGDIRAGSSRPC
jgi:hypothetical protein